MTDQTTSDHSPIATTTDTSATHATPVADRAAPPADTREPSRGSEKRTDILGWVRIAAALALAAVAVGVWFDTAPSDNSFASERSSIEAMDDANNLRAEGAPQQEVVNGWTTIEYLNLLSEQQEQSNNRLDALLLLALLGGSVALATSRNNAST
jgi:hypothetical protein